MGTNRYGRQAPILKKGNGKAAANQVNADDTDPAVRLDSDTLYASPQ